MRRPYFLPLLSGLFMFIAHAAALRAQDLASLSVTILDQSSSAIGGAQLRLKNQRTGLVRLSVSTDSGTSVLPGLPAAGYELDVEADRFAPYRSALVLTVGQLASLNIVLQLAGVTAQVEVHAAAQSVDAERSELSQVIDTRAIGDLPIAGRDFIDFVLLTPSANVGRSTAVGSQSPFTETVLELSFGGLRETHSSLFSLDGIDYTTSISGVQRLSPSQDWVQEFRVIASPNSADFGRNLGSVVNTLAKSGTNQVHGSLYDFFRNNKLDATNVLAAPGFNTLRFQQFGANIGGPIRQQKNFYFAGYEGQRRAESPVYSSFILSCTDGAACLGPGTPSINAVKRSLGLQAESLGSILGIDDFDKFLLKSTNVLTGRATLDISYLWNDDRKQHTPGAPPGQGLPSSFRNNPVRDQNLSANLFRLLGAASSSETLLNFGNRNFHLEPVGAGFEPAITITDLLNVGGFQGSVRRYDEKHFQAIQTFAFLRGPHSLKFGGEFHPVWIGAQTTFTSPGFAVFTPQSFFGAPPFDLPPFGPGTAVQFLFLEPRQFLGQQVPQRTLPFETGLYTGPAAPAFADATHLAFWHKLLALSAQDQWKIRPNLTFSAGLRYDVDLFPSANDIRITGGLHPTNWRNIQPRTGLAYSFRGGLGVIRAGFGLFTGPFDYSDLLVSWQGAAALSYMHQSVLPGFSDPAANLIGFGVSGIVGASGPIAGAAAFRNFAQNGIYPSPASLQQFPLGYAKRHFDSAYAEQASLEIENQVASDLFVSLAYRHTHALKLPLYFSINAIPNGTLPNGIQAFTPADPNFGFTLYASPSAYSSYDAGTLSLRKNFSGHYSALANYVYAKSIDLTTDVQLTGAPMNYLNPRLDRAPGDNDVRHRFAMALLAETPSNWSALLRNFKASALTTLQTPRRYTLFAGFDVNGDGFPFSDRVGLIGRNTYRGKPSYTTDVRLQRSLALNDRFQLQASIEAFNLFNRPNLLDVDTVYGAAEFLGPVPKRFGDSIISPANPTFGSPRFVVPARQLQLSLRLNF
jgi:Carboxypeptidase regulatory-like domain